MINAASSAFNDIAHRPSDLLTYVGNSADPCASTQIHHLIPREIWNNPDGFLSKSHVRQVLNIAGGMNSPMNLMELPSTIAGATASNLALHNGAHPVAYTNAVQKGLSAVEAIYNAALIANGGVSSPETDLLLVGEILALQLSLRLRLDRSSGVPEPLMLSNSDPNFHMASPEYQSEMATLGTIVDGVQANPRDGYPTNSSAQQACESVRALTADQLRSTATDLRNKAWAGVPDGSRPDDPSAGVLAHEQITQQLPQIKERTLANLYEQTARENPFDASMFKLGTTMLMATGGALMMGARAVATAAASIGGAVMLTSNPAEATPTKTGIPLPEVLPKSHAEMAKGTDEMGDRGEVKRIALERAGGPAEGHLIILKDGSVIPGTIPFDNNPKIAAGKNGETLGVLYDGKGAMNEAQACVASDISSWLTQSRQREGLSSNIEVIAGSTNTAEILGLPTPRGLLPTMTQQIPQSPEIRQQRTIGPSGP